MFAVETVRFVRMKKILEVLRFGENDIRFHTDIDPLQDPDTAKVRILLKIGKY